MEVKLKSIMKMNGCTKLGASQQLLEVAGVLFKEFDGIPGG